MTAQAKPRNLFTDKTLRAVVVCLLASPLYALLLIPFALANPTVNGALIHALYWPLGIIAALVTAFSQRGRLMVGKFCRKAIMGCLMTCAVAAVFAVGLLHLLLAMGVMLAPGQQEKAVVSVFQTSGNGACENVTYYDPLVHRQIVACSDSLSIEGVPNGRYRLSEAVNWYGGKYATLNAFPQ